MAGRNQEKLEKERTQLAKEYPAVKSVPILTGDAQDLNSLLDIASQTKVLISTSGPYAKIGGSVVKACVAAGTHYCDITGKSYCCTIPSDSTPAELLPYKLCQELYLLLHV